MTTQRRHINPQTQELLNRIALHKRAVRELTRLHKLRTQHDLIESRIVQVETFLRECGFGQDI